MGRSILVRRIALGSLTAFALGCAGQVARPQRASMEPPCRSATGDAVSLAPAVQVEPVALAPAKQASPPTSDVPASEPPEPPSVLATTAIKVPKARGQGFQDPNIALRSLVNHALAEPPNAPWFRRGALAPDAAEPCVVKVENYSPHLVEVFVDKEISAVISPWGTSEIVLHAVSATLYAVSDFDDNTRLAWGPSRIAQCVAGGMIVWQVQIQ